MRVLVTILTVLIMATNIFAQTNEKRVALVIGNKNYRYGGALTYPIQDAETMKEVLKELNFEVIYLLDGTETQMTTSFLQFIRKVGNANISLIYYSGHGMQIDGVNHLIPVNANIIDKHSAKELTININNWVSQLEANEQNLNIVILDACRNNPYKAFTKSTEKGLKQIPAPSGTIISFATLPDNVAQDNGLFAKTLAFEMRKDQRIIDVFMNTRNTIEAKTNKQQSPMEWVRYNRAINLVSDGSGSDYSAKNEFGDIGPNKESYSFNTINALRNVGSKISVSNAKRMVLTYNFVHKNWNPTGTGIKHEYSRINISGYEIVVDKSTGLYWQAKPSESRYKYADALDYVRRLNATNFAGRSNWRLPTLEEAMSLVSSKNNKKEVGSELDYYLDPIFTAIWQRFPIWTCDRQDENYVWVVRFEYGISDVFDINGSYYAPVLAVSSMNGDVK